MKKIALLLLVFGLISVGTAFAQVEISGLDRLCTTFTEDGSSYANRLRLNFSLAEESYGAYGRLQFDASDSATSTIDVKYAYAWTDLANSMFTLTVGKVWDDTTYDYEVTSGLSDYVLGNFSSYNNLLSS